MTEISLAHNTNPYGCAPGVRDVLARMTHADLHRYPRSFYDNRPGPLVDRVAREFAVAPSLVALALALIVHRVRKPDWSIVVGDLRLLCGSLVQVLVVAGWPTVASVAPGSTGRRGFRVGQMSEGLVSGRGEGEREAEGGRQFMGPG